MSRLFDPFNLPSLEDVINYNMPLLRRLKKAGITNVVPLMFLPEGSPFGQGVDIKVAADKHITASLRQAGLKRRGFSDKFVDFATEQFGCIEDTPISALQVAIVDSDQINYPELAPLDLVTFFEHYSCHLTILNLVQMGREGINAFIDVDPRSEEILRLAPIRDREDDLANLEARLVQLGLSLRIDDPVLDDVGLHAVS